MPRRARLWTGALAVSLLLHAGAAMVLVPRQEAVQVAGGEPVDIAVLGNAFEDAVVAGEPAEHVEPVETAEPVRAVEAVPEAASPASHAPVGSSEPKRAVPAEPVEAGEVAVPLDPEADGAVAVSTETAREAAAEAASAVTGDDEAEASEAEAVAAVERVSPIVDVPVPTPRPDYEPIREARQQAARAAPAPRQQNTRPSAGSDGRSQADSRRGSAEGAAEGGAARSSGQGAQTAAGNAAVSNYPGQVVTRLRRALRYPSQARRQRLNGETHVGFTVALNGSVSGVRVVRSSGHAVLDEAAVETVRRAAPFPAIPEAANRRNWDFVVPLAFSR